jgi:hypothetical protein
LTLTLSVAPTLTLTLTVTLTIQAARGRRRNSYAERLKRVATAERLVTRLESDTRESRDSKERLRRMSLGRPAGIDRYT